MSERIENILQSLNEEVDVHKVQLQEITIKILSNDVTNYPIWVFHEEDIELGKMMIDKVDYAMNWSVSISHLEEFAHKKIIHESKIEDFRKMYKDPREFLCLFLMIEQKAQFVFVPFDF